MSPDTTVQKLLFYDYYSTSGLQKSVIQAINNLTDTLGIRTFKKYFHVILTDNGSEFKNPWDIEKQKTEHHAPMSFTVILMSLTKKHHWKRITNTFAMSSQKDAVCKRIHRKI